MDPDSELLRRIAALNPAERQALLARLGVTSRVLTDGRAAQKRLELSIALKRSLVAQCEAKARRLN